MKKPFTTKLAAIFLVAVALTASLAPFSVKKAHAILGEGDQVQVVLDTSPSGISNWVHNVGEYTKDFVLNTLANAFIKQLAHQITLSIVNWINGGFQGSPAFVQDPAGFFEGIGDNIAGNFIGGPGSPLAALCSPIALNIRLALAIGQANLNNPYACTLTSVISNIKGATINGFEAGDFNQGGWQSFATLAQPQNSYNGAYVQASADLSVQIDGATAVNKDLLNQGSGFLSWQSCTPTTPAQGAVSNLSQASASAGLDSGLSTLPTAETLDSLGVPPAPAGSVGTARSDPGTGASENCQTETPGSFISQQLNFSANSPLQQLDVQDNINAIVGALMSQLVTKALSAGLGTVSGSHPGDSTAYISQIQQQEAAQNAGVSSSLGQSYSSDISPFVNDELQAKQYVDSSLSLASSTASTYQSTLSYCASVGDASIQSQLAAVINTTINPLISSLTAEDASTTAKYSALLYEQTSAASASSVAGLQTTVGANGQSFSTGDFESTPQDLTNAQNENSQIETQTNQLNASAASALEQCQAYAQSYGDQPTSYTI